jgi:primosomal protein N' (replication factor Y)
VAVTIDQPALQGLAPRRRRPRSPEPVAEHLPVAQVVVDRPQPHLDRPFDYAVPAGLADAARPGVRVRVRFAGQDVDGWCVGRTDASEHADLAPVRRVVSPEPVLAPPVLALARAVADRWVGTLPDVLRLAVPPRHARTEREVPPAADGSPVPWAPWAPAAPGGGAPPGADGTVPPSWADVPGAGAFLRRVAAGQAPRAVWQALPGPPSSWADAVAAAVVAAVAAGRGALVVAPSQVEVAAVEAALDRAGVPAWSPEAPGGRVRLLADDGPAERYRAFLATLRGHAPVVVGTRAAAFAPVARLGLLVCWDDGDDLLAEPRAPYPHARDVLVMRAEAEGAALLLGSHARTAAAQRLVATGWAHPLDPPRAVVRRRAPRVVALTSVELAREGPAAAARLPSPAWRAAREALERGPVLVQVPRAGYVPALACDACRASARCGACGGPVALAAPGAPPGCRLCGAPAVAWRCGECGGTRLRAVRVGSARTAEELGRAFPGVPVRVSGGGARLDTLPARPAVVVATPGAEPVAEGQYAAALLLDAAVATGRPHLDAGEQALRSWLRAAALVRPAAEGGVVLLVGDGAPVPTQAFVRWDPAGHAERELAERAEVRMPPAVHVVAVEGPRDAVRALLDRAGLPVATEVVGPVPVPEEDDGGDAAPALLEVAGEQPVRALLRSPWAEAAAVARAVRAAVAAASARREPPVRVRAEPGDVW